MQRTSLWIALFVLWIGIRPADAQSPPPDNAPSFFSGEWAGTGERGSFCYVSLRIDGSGWVLVDAGTGDWSGARIQWQNRRQSLQIDTIVPLRSSTPQRFMPLDRFELRSEFNQSLSLTWATPDGSCHLQRIETVVSRLSRAQRAVVDLPPGEGAQ
jgi:hypothetical protein